MVIEPVTLLAHLATSWAGVGDCETLLCLDFPFVRPLLILCVCVYVRMLWSFFSWCGNYIHVFVYMYAIIYFVPPNIA